MKPWLRWTLGIGTGLVLAVVALWQNENRRGQRMWEETCARLRAAGEPVELADIIPPMIPDEENVAAAPIFAEVFRDEEGSRLYGYAEAFRGREVRNKDGQPIYKPFSRALSKLDLSELEEWREFLRACEPAQPPEGGKPAAEEILHLLKPWNELRREIEQALRRPTCRWPLQYTDGLVMRMPLSTLCLGVLQSNRPRILAQAAMGDADACTETLLTDLRLVRAINQGEFLLIGQLVASTGDLLTLQSLQHTLAMTPYDGQKLAALQHQLEAITVDGILSSIRNERVAGSQSCLKYTLQDLEWLYAPRMPDWLDKLPNAASEAMESAARLAVANRPEGWKLMDAAGYNAFVHDEVQRCVDARAGTITPARVRAMLNAASTRSGTAANLFLPEKTVESFRIVLTVAAKHQAIAREASLWCAIESYRIRYGKLPETLDELRPEFVAEVPCDPVNGLALRYVRKSERDYILYSIGWNEVDDGGVETRRRETGDWVWASDPRLIVNLDEEKRKAEEAVAAKRTAERTAAKAKQLAERKAKAQEEAVKKTAEERATTKRDGVSTK